MVSEAANKSADEFYLSLLRLFLNDIESFSRLVHSECRYARLSRKSDQRLELFSNVTECLYFVYTRLLPSYFRQCFTQDEGMVETESSNASYDRSWNDIGTIIPAAYSYFKNCGINLQRKFSSVHSTNKSDTALTFSAIKAWKATSVTNLKYIGLVPAGITSFCKGYAKKEIMSEVLKSTRRIYHSPKSTARAYPIHRRSI